MIGIKTQQYIRTFFTSDLHSRIAKGAMWSVFGALSSKGLLLIGTVLLVHILGKDAYGRYGIIRSTINMFIVFAGVGIGMTNAKYVASHRNDPDKIGSILGVTLCFTFVFGIIIFSLCYLGSGFIARESLHDANLSGELKIGAFMILLASFNSVMQGALNGFEAFDDIAKVNIVAAFFSLLSITAGGWIWGITGALYGLLIFFALTGIGYLFFFIKYLKRYNIRITIVSKVADWIMLWKFTLPTILSGLLVSPIIWLSNTFLIKQGGFGSFAVYEVANQWRLLVLFIPGVLGQMILPILSNIDGENNHSEFKKVVKLSFLVNIALAVFISVPIMLLSPWILRCYGAGFSSGAWTMVLLLLATIICVANSVIGQVIMSKGHAWIGFTFNSMWGVGFIISAYYMVCILKLGAIGLGLSYVISYTMHTLWQGWYIMRFFKSG